MCVLCRCSMNVMVIQRKRRNTPDNQQKSQQDKHVERAEVLFAPHKLSNSKNELRCCASSASATFQRISMERFQETNLGGRSVDLGAHWMVQKSRCRNKGAN